MKVMTILGTRPEIIRLSRVMAALDAVVEHKIVHTGQNYDYELNAVFFEELGVRQPDYFLNVDASTLGRCLGGILIKTEEVLLKEKPDAVLVLGDTNSATAIIMAKRMKIPTYHMEAGNRCFDGNVPEEINRKLVDHVADFNLVYTEHARRHLLSEGLPQRRIYLTGSPLREVLTHYKPKIERSDALERIGVSNRGYFLVSLHREENVDNKKKLSSLVDTLSTIGKQYDVPVIVSTHPRTRKRLEALGVSLPSSIQFMKPFGFLDYNKLQMHALCVLSDSGSITEEASILNFPAVTLRTAIERPEGLDTGSIVIAGLDPAVIQSAIKLVIDEFDAGRCPPIPADYCIDNCAQRVVRLILGTSRLSNAWDGIEHHDYK